MDLLLIGGVSGSGKSVALAALEDSGYHAINNLPPKMLVDTVANLASSGQERVAIALDVKTGPGLPGLAQSIATVRALGWTVRFLYLDAKTDGGGAEAWAFELGSPNRLMRYGWSQDSLTAGTRVTIVGSRARDGSLKAAATDVTLPDGKQLFGAQETTQ